MNSFRHPPGLLPLGLLLTATFGGCATEPAEPGYVEPVIGAPAAVVVNQGSTGTQAASLNCQLPGETHVCRVWLASVDGRAASFESRSTRVAPGRHDVRIGCNSWRGGLAVIGAISSSFTSYSGTFDAGQTYFVRCTRGKDSALAFIAASAEGPALPGFTSDADAP